MILGNEAMLAAVKAGHILVEPFDPENVNGASIDLSLGHYVFREKKRNIITRLVDRLFDRALDTDGMAQGDPWSDKPQIITSRAQSQRNSITLDPGEFILACSQEKAGTTVPNLQWFLGSRSTSMRWGIQICACSGKGDPGYANIITYEIKNLLRYHRLRLWFGQRIGQIYFMDVRGNTYLYDRQYGLGQFDPQRMRPKSARRRD